MAHHQNFINRCIERKVARLRAAPLHSATLNGDFRVCRRLLEDGEDVNTVDRCGNIPLLLAIKKGHTEIAKLFINNGADVAIRDKNSDTPLHYAVLFGNVEIGKVIIGKGGDVNVENENGFTPTYVAVKVANTDFLKLLISKDARITTKSTFTLLHLACYYGYLDISKILIENGANINALFNRMATPFVVALLLGHGELAKFLITKGADITIRIFERTLKLFTTWEDFKVSKVLFEKKELNAVSEAEKNQLCLTFKRQTDLPSLYLSYGADVTTICERSGDSVLDAAILYGNLVVSEEPVGKGTCITEGNNIQYMPLLLAGKVNRTITNLLISKGDDKILPKASTSISFAIWNGSLDNCKMLLENGGDVNALYFNGYNPLLMAIAQKCTETCKYLIIKGVDITTRTGFGRTFLHYASLYGNLKICKVLLKKGLDINAVDRCGDTPLLLSSRPKIARYLIYKGADITIRNKKDKTALHIVKNPKVAGILLKKGADVNAADKFGDTPLISAIKGRRTEIVKLLISKGAGVIIHNKEEETPLQIAVENINQEICEMLLDKRDN